MTKNSIFPAAEIFLLSLLLVSIFAPLTAEASLASTPWPMFHHDLQHTGMSPYFGSQTPTLKWMFTTGNEIYSSPTIGSDGTIYVGSSDRNLYALNPDGSQKWKFTTGGGIFSSSTIASDGTIYVGSGDGYLYAVNPDGTQKWKFTTGGLATYSSPAIGSDGTVYIKSTDGNFYAVNPDGTQKWKFTTGQLYYFTYSSPAITSDGTIYVGSDDNNLYALNPDGSQKWMFTTGGLATYSSPAIGSDGTIYVGSDDNNLYALNPDGSQKWMFTTGNEIYSSPAIGSDGTIYVGSIDHNLYAVNPDGTLKWKFTTGDHVYSSPAIGSDGTIYVGSYDHNFYAVNSDGTLKWKFTTGNTVFSSPAIGSDGTIYVGSYDDNLYAIGWSPFMLQPWEGPVGQSVTVSGTKFAPSSSITITFDSKTVATATSDASGSFTTTFRVPKSTAGSHAVMAKDGSGNLGSAAFTVIPTIKDSPRSGTAGTSVMVTGNGFAADSLVRVRFGGMPVATTTTDGKGSFTATFLVPSFTPGHYNIKTTDHSGNSYRIKFTVH